MIHSKKRWKEYNGKCKMCPSESRSVKAKTCCQSCAGKLAWQTRGLSE